LGFSFSERHLIWIGVMLDCGQIYQGLSKDYFNKIILMVSKLDDSNLLPTFKEHSQFKRCGIWNF
jgi:hypothetical protein